MFDWFAVAPPLDHRSVSSRISLWLHATTACLLLGWPAPIGLTGTPPGPALPDAIVEKLSSGTYTAVVGANPGSASVHGEKAASSAPNGLHAQAATLDPKVGANRQLGNEPADLPAQRRAQAEPHIARSFSDTNLIAATVQEGRYEDGGAVTCGYAISRDGGATWKRGLIPGLVSSLDGGRFMRVSDPVAGVDAQGGVWMNTLGILSLSPRLSTAVVLSRSTNGGETFDPPITVYEPENEYLFPDKNWFTINTFTATPTAGRIVVTFTLFDSSDIAFPKNTICSMFSDDHGRTWSTPVQISSSDCQGSQPVFLPDGSLAVIFWNFSAQAIEMALSEDGGRTFNKPATVAPVRMHADPLARTGTFLPAAVADRHAGVIHVSWQALLLRGGTNVPVIMHCRSMNKGLAWTAPVPLNDTPGARSVFNPAVAVSPEGQHVSIVFYDKRHDPGAGYLVDLYLAESFDGGETWQPNLRLSDTSSDLRLAPRTGSGYMLGDYQGVAPALNFSAPGVVAYVDTRSGSPDLSGVSIARTQGATFASWQKLWFTPGQLSDPDLAGEHADADADGLPNLLEYALGRNPRHADAVRFEAAPATVGQDSVLRITCEPLAILDDVVWTWRASEDLRSWVPVVPSGQQEPPAPDPVFARLQTTFVIDRAGARFFSAGLERKSR